MHIKSISKAHFIILLSAIFLLIPIKAMKKITILFALLSAMVYSAGAQITCSGVWGQNIVYQTFGQGTPTATWYGPLNSYAPGATTSTIFVGAAGPALGQLSDGYSGLAKTPSASNQGNWINVPDHTGNTDGLLFLINAPSTAATTFFEYQMDNLCPNTTLKLSVWVLNVNDPSLITNPTYQYPNITLKAIDPATNTVLGTSQTGNVAADQLWHQYSVVFNNGFSSSIKLQLVNNSVGSGYGNDLAIDDITVQPCVPVSQILPKLDTSICEYSAPILFNATVLNSPYSPAEYQWQYSDDGGATWTNQGVAGSNTTFAFNTPSAPAGTYLIRYLTGPQGTTGNTNCGAISDTSTLTVVNLPYEIRNETICQGTTTEFFGHHYGLPGTYDTIVKSGPADLCGISYTLNLKVNPLPDVRVVNRNIELCQGDTVAIELLSPSPGADYQWIQNGAAIPGGTGVQYMASTGGTYYVAGHNNVASGVECVDTSDRIVVNLRPVPDVSIINKNKPGCSFDTLSFSAGTIAPSYLYNWSPESAFRTISGFEGATAKGIFDKSTMVTLTIYSPYGCHASDSTLAVVYPCCEVFTPSAFSPNGDGLNEFFNPAMEPGQLIISMRVYDRYGKMIYNNGSPKLGWNGTYLNGEVASTGVYMYQIQYSCSDNKIYTRKGDITLLR
jgi:gliding motility-associated-like protein